MNELDIAGSAECLDAIIPAAAITYLWSFFCQYCFSTIVGPLWCCCVHKNNNLFLFSPNFNSFVGTCSNKWSMGTMKFCGCPGLARSAGNTNLKVTAGSDTVTSSAAVANLKCDRGSRVWNILFGPTIRKNKSAEPTQNVIQ